MKTTKKIAIATAAALAIFGISSVAHATPLAVTVNSVANVTTSAAPQAVSVPVSNVIDTSNTVALTATVDTATAVSFVGSGVRLVSALATPTIPVTTVSGVSSLSFTSAGLPITVYAYTTSSNVGSVTITNGAYSTIVYVKGIAGVASNVLLSVPNSSATNTSPSVSVSATDVFGNPVASEPISVTLINGSFSDGSITKVLTTSAVTSAPGVTPVTVLGSATSSLSALSEGTVTVVATDTSIGTNAVGLRASVKTAIATISVTDLNAQINLLNTKLSKSQDDNAKSQSDLSAEKAAHASDMASAQTTLQSEKAAHLSDVAGLQSAFTAEKTAHQNDVALANAKYNALVKLYNAKAKKYHFATIK
jgi:hypothetical protein